MSSAVTGLLALALAALFLNAAGTVEAGFTLQVSYGLTALAAVVGAPWVVRGWLQLPLGIRVPAAVLAAIYVLSALLGQGETLGGASRSSHRTAVYVGDLGLGLGALGLVVGLTPTRQRLERFVAAMAAGAVVGAAIGLYQWVALRYGWPLADLNSAPNSDGFSTGHRFQGGGLLGWERARGTFKEPLYFGVFLATGAPLLSVLALRFGGARRWATVAGLALAVTALAVTSSSLAWGVLALCVVVAFCLTAIAAGRVVLAGMAGAAVVCALVVGVGTFVNPGALAGLVGRSSSDLSRTTANRTSAWTGALRSWQRRPYLGYGPGQSSVQLAYRPDGAAIAPGLIAPRVLGSAQGLWASALVDCGLLGLFGWALLLTAIGASVVRAAVARGEPIIVGLLTAALVAVVAAQLAGDRLEIRVWLVLAVALAASQLCGAEPADCSEKAEAAAEGR